MRNGGNLFPRYDASAVTHIVTDAQTRPTLRALGLKKLSEIPNHIPTVTWSWVVSRLGKAPNYTKDGTKVRTDDAWLHAAFAERIDAGIEPRPSAKGKGKGKASETEDLSNISCVSWLP